MDLREYGIPLVHRSFEVKIGTPGTISLDAGYVDTAEAAAIDPRSGFRYRAKWIGRQYWMLDNLRKCDSCSIPHRLNFAERMDTICPSGWHVPDTSEWLRLLRYAAGGGWATDGLFQIKSTEGWYGFGAYDGRWNGDDGIGFGLTTSNFAINPLTNGTFEGEYYGQYLTSTPGVPYFYVHENSFEFTSMPISPLGSSWYGNLTESAVRCLAD